MAVKELGNALTETVSAEAPEWISGGEARRLLGWDSTASVRNRAKMGGFRWKKRPNGSLEYHRGDVLEYRRRCERDALARARASEHAHP